MTELILSSILLGVALAMDAFSVSIANGLKEPGMKKGRMCLMAGCYAFFQFIMPLCGYLIVHTIVGYFAVLQKAAMWVGFLLLIYLGVGMLIEGIRERKNIRENGLSGLTGKPGETTRLKTSDILLQGLATSIDALSTGFAISEYTIPEGTLAALIIMLITFIICLAGLKLGKKLGTIFAGRATILGGLILILIGIKLVI